MQGVLCIYGKNIPDISFLECQQEILSLPQGFFYRTINGELFYEETGKIKYQTRILSKEQHPLLGALVKGEEYMIDCLELIWQNYNQEKEFVFLRDPVDSKIFLKNREGKTLTVLKKDSILIKNIPDNIHFICYRPKMRTRLMDIQLKTNEWDSQRSSLLVFEEI